ncbi:hypothetical protein [Aurantiacibacter rhizosphaerae]|uniref:Uncharacterized protein n=1 Tax=Aurantiacibacter rhizosphaerae TaxID=2691582 RepID=A0A844XIL0_9SPHN|nr:hypothetical protein [Aurantiacibacter rhizosphaerae]MWV29384.1 hypothetical protein [Aurantiacibacter rhizosphaerae]
MGNATSSALRADDPATSAPVSAPARGGAPGEDGPAFGSLATLGGPKKFKKKPVLVLDPEELEKAHMLFQDASAELLGEDVERPERAAPVLGLAPMALDDGDADPIDAGEDGEDIEDGEIPSAEELLRMTASRPAPDDEGEDEDEAAIAAHLERLDIDRRIFPSLPLKSEDEIAAEEEAERLAAEQQSAMDEAELEMDLPPPEADGEEQEGFVEETSDYLHQAQDEAPAPLARPAGSFPVNLLPEPEPELLHPAPTVEDVVEEPAAEFEPQAEETIATAKAVFGDEPFLDFPTQHISWTPEDEPAQEAELSSTAPELPEPELPEPEVDAAELHAPEMPEPAPYEPEAELPPVEYSATLPDVDDDQSNRFEWAYEDDEDEAVGQTDPAADEPPKEVHWPEPEAEPEPETPDYHDGSYTEIDDDQVDGYAFMYANNPRGRTIHALAEGESNSLRAKLIKEREDLLAKMEADEQKPSLLARFTGWLRGLVG